MAGSGVGWVLRLVRVANRISGESYRKGGIDAWNAGGQPGLGSRIVPRTAALTRVVQHHAQVKPRRKLPKVRQCLD